MPDERPTPPDLPTYLLDPLDRQPASRLEDVAAYASALAAWKRGADEADAAHRRAAESVDEEALATLDERGVSTDPDDYDDVPANGAYVTVKTTKQSGGNAYRYYYWQWRDGGAWKNEYIAPVDPK